MMMMMTMTITLSSPAMLAACVCEMTCHNQRIADRVARIKAVSSLLIPFMMMMMMIMIMMMMLMNIMMMMKNKKTHTCLYRGQSCPELHHLLAQSRTTPVDSDSPRTLSTFWSLKFSLNHTLFCLHIFPFFSWLLLLLTAKEPLLTQILQNNCQLTFLILKI